MGLKKNSTTTKTSLKKELLKAAHQYAIVTMDQMATFTVKGVANSDELTDHYHPTLLFRSALLRFVVSFSWLFWF